MKGNITKTIGRRDIRRGIIIVVVSVLFAALITILLTCDKESNSYIPDLPDIRFNGDVGYSTRQAQRGMKLKGVTGLEFDNGSLVQVVDIPNVSENEYAFVLSIYLSDGTQIFKSDYVYPGDVLETIELSQPLRHGIYKNAMMVYSCYTVDSSHIAVSRCEFPIEIKCN